MPWQALLATHDLGRLHEIASIVMTVSGGPTLLGLPVFGLLGYLGAAAGGVWLLLSIWKSSKANRE